MLHNELLTAIGWKSKLNNYLDKNFDNILKHLKKVCGNDLLPKKQVLFRTFNLCDFEDTYVVIMKDRPYINELDIYNDGLAFSIRCDLPPPDKCHLNYIFEDLKTNYYKNKTVPSNFYDKDLSKWSVQGVLLFNKSLTATLSYNHHDVYWNQFSKEVMKILNEGKPITIILVGKKVCENKIYFDSSKHNIILANEDSYEDNIKNISEIFKNTNKWLKKTYNKEIIW